MNNFVYHVPTEVVFGKGTVNETPSLVKKYGGSRVFIVYGGGSVVRSGLLGQVKQLLTDAGLTAEEFGGAKPNPLLSHAREGVEKALAFHADFILAIGGGSAIDTAKAIAHGCAAPDTDIWKFWMKEATVGKTTPLGVILTIPAAGSETSNSAVLTNPEMERKKGLTTEFNRPLFAIMNPELTFTLPPFQLSCGITDIMMHTLDRYINPNENELTDAIAEALLRTVIAAGRIAVKDQHNYEAMSEIMWAGSLSHNTLTGLGAKFDMTCHQLGHALSARYDTAHGASLSMTWASMSRYIYDANVKRFARYARNVWGINETDDEKAALAGIGATEEYFRSIGMPVRLSEGIESKLDDEELKHLAHSCSFQGTRTIGTLKTLGENDMYEIYKMAR